jgi:hypothetical protein
MRLDIRERSLRVANDVRMGKVGVSYEPGILHRFRVG